MSSHHNSLRWRSGVNLVVIAAALVAITVITNAYSFNLMLRNFRQSLSSTALIYTEQISGKVDKINSGSLELVSLAASSQNYYTSSPLGRYLTQQDILTRLQDRIRYVESSDLYFFYRTDSDELLTALSNRASTGSSYFWNQYLMLPPTQPANTWFSVTCNGETWLMCYYNVSQVRVGAAVRAKTLLQSLYADTGLVQDSGFALAGLDGTIVYSSQPDLMACGTSLAGHIPASLIVESHTIDTGQHLVFLVVFPVSTGLLGDLEGLQRLGVGQVRSDAHVNVLALLEEAELGFVDQISHVLDLVVLLALLHQLHSLVTGQDEGLDGQIFLADLAHLFFDVGQIVIGELGVAQIDIVVEAVLGGRAKGEVSLGIQALDSLRHDVSSGVADNMQFLVQRALVHMAVFVDDLHSGSPFDES